MSNGRIIITNNGVKMIARITYNAADAIINIVHLPGGGESVYFKFQVTGMISCNNQNPKNFLAQKLTPKKSHADFPSLKNFRKALNDVTRKIKVQKRVCFYFIRRTTRPGCAGTTANTAPPQNLGIENFKPIKSLYYLNHLESGVLPTPAFL